MRWEALNWCFAITTAVARYGESGARGRRRSHRLSAAVRHVVSCLLCLPMHDFRPRLSGGVDWRSNCDLSYVLRTQTAALIMSRAAGSRLRHSLAALARCGGPPSVEEAIRAAQAPWVASPPWHLAGGGGGSCLWRQRAVAASSSAAAPQPPSVRRSKGSAAGVSALCCMAPAGVWCCSTPCPHTPFVLQSAGTAGELGVAQLAERQQRTLQQQQQQRRRQRRFSSGSGRQAAWCSSRRCSGC